MLKTFFVALAVIVSAAVAPLTISSESAAAPTPCSDFEAVAHRGFHPLHVDENSLDAFTFAAQGGYSIETDVWADAEGQLWLFHDRDVSRATDGTGFIDEMTTAEVAALHYREAGSSIPTLEQGMEVFEQYPDVRVYLELQQQESVDPVVGIVRSSGRARTTWFTALTDQVHAVAPELNLELKFPDPLPDPATAVADGLSILLLNPTQITPDIVDTYHEAGIEIQQRTSNKAAEWDSAIAAGADGQMTDLPDELIAHCNGTLPPPLITGFTPESAPPGTPIVISGNHLSETSSVLFDTAGADFDVDSGGQITATVPVAAPTVTKVSVETPGGVAASQDEFVVLRSRPVIGATVAPGPAATGWYTAPVVVSFACAPAGADLATPCPAAVQLASSGRGQSATGSVAAVDGGASSVTVVGLDIDLESPSVAIKGAKNRRVYDRPPRPRCRASDPTSGVASCTITRRRKSHDRFRVTATATDVAGHVSILRIRYRVLPPEVT